MDEGYIKFKVNWERGDAPQDPGLSGLIHWRDRMFDLGLIGFDQIHQVGFGNISIRVNERAKFIISGTQTGHIARLGAKQFTTVVDYSIENNELTCCGPVKASSESLTHAAIYEVDSSIGAVIHIHHDKQWEKWLGNVPTTNEHVSYGTPEMAQEIKRLFDDYGPSNMDLIAMAGHQGGLISFGETLDQAAKPFLKAFA